nr:cycloartenol-c-24-methyltransferase [Quercus suber]
MIGTGLFLEELNRIAGVDKTCKFVKADFMKMLFPDNTFDAVYVIEATCHAPDVMCIPNSNTITLARMAHHFPLFKYTEQIIAWTVFCCI